ncbi:hypothetical protein [Spongiactinospora sp. TRM90649]|uniref:hypothetical protein n=1 Tax=Spongiactinospora sp. TRM90649 TaxID=3031114 RepID=UPI0023F8AF30|nr:hypothetical protein [Spongiactinospora sp. TRM90649]MDF5756676.1 hypothetical protein [Spongiactinospora sp. TRM90649]
MKNQARKNAVRARMEDTAERYTRARREIIIAASISAHSTASKVISTLHRATGLSIPACGEIYHSGAATPQRPVPDAVSPELRHLEMKVFYALMEPFRDNIGAMGYILGLEAVEPWPDGIVLIPHGRLWHRVINSLLPSCEPKSGNLYGVAGLRFHEENDSHVSLIDLESNLILKVTRRPDRKGLRTLPLDRTPSGFIPLWQRYPDSPSALEVNEWEFDQGRYRHDTESTAARNMLLSRLLRRVAIINSTAKTHGCINLYDHSRRDAVFEWCCGPTVTTFLNSLGETRFCERVERDPERENDDDAWARALIGNDRVLMRRTYCYIPPGYYLYRRTKDPSDFLRDA